MDSKSSSKNGSLNSDSDEKVNFLRRGLLGQIPRAASFSGLQTEASSHESIENKISPYNTPTESLEKTFGGVSSLIIKTRSHSEKNPLTSPLRLASQNKDIGRQREIRGGPSMVGLESDIDINVDSKKIFHLHKFPLFSKTSYFEEHEKHESGSKKATVYLKSFPGGPDTFVQIVNYCYGLPVELSSSNIASVYCAALYLNMVPGALEGRNGSVGKKKSLLGLVDSQLESWLEDWEECIEILKNCEEETCWDHALKGGLIHRCVSSFSKTAVSRVEESLHISEAVMKLNLNTFSRLVAEMRNEEMDENECCRAVMVYVNQGLSTFKAMKENEQKGGNKLEELFQIVAPLKGKPFVKFQLLMAAESLNLNKSLIEALSKSASGCLIDAEIEDLRILSLVTVDKLVRIFVSEVNNSIEVLIPISKKIDGYLKLVSVEEGTSVEEFSQLLRSLPEIARVNQDDFYFAIHSFVHKHHGKLTEKAIMELISELKPSKLSEEALETVANDSYWPLPFIADILVFQKQFYAGKASILQKRNVELEEYVNTLEEELVTTKEVKGQLEDEILAIRGQIAASSTALREEIRQLRQTVTNEKSPKAFTVRKKETNKTVSPKMAFGIFRRSRNYPHPPAEPEIVEKEDEEI